MKNFSSLYDQALNTLKSNTFANMTDKDIENYFSSLAKRAIADFRFPKVSLEYEVQNQQDGHPEYTFKEEITQKEVNVLLVLIKKYWLEQQIDNETSFEDLYYDRDVRTFSRGNMIRSLNERYEKACDEAKRVQYDYSRQRDSEGRPGIGTIYDDDE